MAGKFLDFSAPYFKTVPSPPKISADGNELTLAVGDYFMMNDYQKDYYLVGFDWKYTTNGREYGDALQLMSRESKYNPTLLDTSEYFSVGGTTGWQQHNLPFRFEGSILLTLMNMLLMRGSGMGHTQSDHATLALRRFCFETR